MSQSTFSNSWVTLETRIHIIKKYVLDKKFRFINLKLAETEFEDIYAIMILHTIRRSELLHEIQDQIQKLMKSHKMKLKIDFYKKNDETFNSFDAVVFHIQNFQNEGSEVYFTEHYQKLVKRL